MWCIQFTKVKICRNNPLGNQITLIINTKIYYWESQEDLTCTSFPQAVQYFIQIVLTSSLKCHSSVLQNDWWCLKLLVEMICRCLSMKYGTACENEVWVGWVFLVSSLIMNLCLLLMLFACGTCLCIKNATRETKWNIYYNNIALMFIVCKWVSRVIKFSELLKWVHTFHAHGILLHKYINARTDEPNGVQNVH